MKLSAFSVVDAYPPGPPREEERLREVVQLAESAEAGGLSALWVAEHHFHAGGICPSPPVLLAACGARTRRLRLGSMVSVLPFHRPIDVAEEYAMVDQLLGGRLNLGVGSGYIPMEFEGFGVDPATKRDRFEASLDSILTAFRGESVHAHEGALPVRLNVLPVQRPHPPVWIAVQRREAVPFVARRGVSIALIPYATLGGLDELKGVVREFRESAPPGLRSEVAVAIHLYAGARPDRARTAFRRYLESRLQTQSTFYREKAKRDPHHATPEAIEAGGFAMFGAPDSVADGLRGYSELGVDEVLGIFDFGGLDAAEVGRSVTALGPAWAARSS